MWFKKDTDRIFDDKLQKGRPGHFAEKDLRNRKHGSNNA